MWLYFSRIGNICLYFSMCASYLFLVCNVVFSLLSQNTVLALIFSPLVNPESMTWREGSGKMKTLVTFMRTWWT